MARLSGPAFWALASLGFAVVASALGWLLLRLVLRRGPLARWPLLPAVGWLLQALFALWPPVLAWRYGALSPYYMGLTETDWLDALGTSGLLTVAIIGLAVLGWLVYRRRAREDGLLQAGAGPDPAQSPAPTFERPRWLAPVSAALDQWHWAFYRAAAIGWLAAGAVVVPAELATRIPFLAALLAKLLALWQAQPLYWGCWLGLLLAGIEWLATPFTWRALRTPGRMEQALRAASLCLAATALFSLTRNFWLCLLCSLAVETLVAGWFPMPEEAPFSSGTVDKEKPGFWTKPGFFK